MLKLTREENRAVNGKTVATRTYVNTDTGTEISTYHLYTDMLRQRWWTFEDLFGIPMIRQMAAKKVVDLYGHDLSLQDILAHTTELKGLLRSTDAEKYEKAYAKVLELETLSRAMADPVKQCIGLCTVYLLLDDEDPAVYFQPTQNRKLSTLALDVDAQAFFLSWWTDHMRQSGRLLKGLSQIVSNSNGPLVSPTPAPVSS